LTGWCPYVLIIRMVWERSYRLRFGNLASAALLTGLVTVLAQCGGSTTASDDEEPSGEGGDGSGATGGATVGGASGTGGKGSGGDSAASSGGDSGTGGGMTGGSGGDAASSSGGASASGGDAGDGPSSGGASATGGNGGAGGSGGSGGASPSCGNGSVDSGEGCDDGNLRSLDGCSENCGVEDGFQCVDSPSRCIPTTCGDGMLEGTEGCDDGNATPLDGCSPSCTIEPNCDPMAGCAGTCGDGIVIGEDCDDGNTIAGDGCSPDCMVESGFTCSSATCEQIGGQCVLRVPTVFRDFNANTVAGGHPDFAPGFNSTGAEQGLVEANLDADGKPVLTSLGSDLNGFVHGQTYFAQWYRDTAGVNATIPGELVLWDDGAGGYVSRWGATGEQWTSLLSSTEVVYGGSAGGGCTECTPASGQVCLDPCTAEFYETYSCCGPPGLPSYDGNPLFFPIDDHPSILTETRLEAKVPPQYGFNGWPWEDYVAADLGVTTPIPTACSPFPTALHNFHFTTEVRLWFRYELGRTISLDFLGDDDVWVFVNGHLAVDLGGWHVPLSGTFTLLGDTGETVQISTTLTETGSPITTTTNAAAFGLTSGNLYPLAVFHAERQKEGSSFRLGLRGLEVGKSLCIRN